MGIEVATECFGQVPAVDVIYADTRSRPMSVREFLDHLVAQAPGYRWSDMNGLAVVRPVESWSDPANPLNTRIDPFRLDNGIVSDALALILNVPREHGTLSNRAFSMTFGGGTLLDALNALVQARQGVGWHAGFFEYPPPLDKNLRLGVALVAFSPGDSTEGKRTSGLEIRVKRVSDFPLSR